MEYFSQSNPSTFLNYQFLLKIFLLNFMLQSCNTNNIDLHHLVFTTCTQNQTIQNYDFSKLSIVSSLFQEFLDKSLESKFFETYVGDEKIAILGLFQCRNDLNYNECHICTNSLIDIYSHFCGERIPARIQLYGCYMDYKVEEEREISKLQMLHKVCSKKKKKSRSFLEEMSYAFAQIGSCGMNGNGFCDLSFGKFHVMTQCVGNLGGCDCGECVNKAMKIVHDECAYSLAGEVYLDGCYLSYSYGKNKISSDLDDEGKGSESGRQKLAAIVAGGIVATILLGVVYYFLKSCGKKDDDYW